MKIRTFVALDIPNGALEEIARIRDSHLSDAGRIKWEANEKLHVTLKFLGDTEDNMTGEYSSALEKILMNHKCLDLSFEKFGVFKRGEELKILWAGLNENEALSKLAVDVDYLFGGFGFEKERRGFKPHITLLRFRGNEDQKKIVSLTEIKLPSINFISDTVTFYESKLTGGGSVYRSIKKNYLKK